MSRKFEGTFTTVLHSFLALKLTHLSLLLFLLPDPQLQSNIIPAPDPAPDILYSFPFNKTPFTLALSSAIFITSAFSSSVNLLAE